VTRIGHRNRCAMSKWSSFILLWSSFIVAGVSYVQARPEPPTPQISSGVRAAMLPARQLAKQSPATRSDTGDLAFGRTLVDQYCVSCHNARTKTAELALDTLDLNRV